MPRASSTKPKTDPKRSTEVLTPAISYLRVSTAAQTKEGETGIKRQQQAWAQWLADHPGYRDAGTFKDLGVSGRRKHRTIGALSQLLEKAEAGEIQKGTCLVVESVTRLTRDKEADALELLLKLFRLGLTLSFTEKKYGNGAILTSETHGVWTTLVNRVEASAFEYEEKSLRSQGYWDERREQIAAGELSGAFQARRKGIREAYPFWLDFDPKANKGRGAFRLNKHKRLVLRIFKLAEEMGSTAIARKLGEEGFRSVDARSGGKVLSPADVRGVLINRAVLGEWQSRGAGNRPIGDPVPGVFPPVVTEAEFLAVHQAMAKRGGQKGAKATTRLINLFQGASYCFHCGSVVGVRPGNKRPSGGRYHYLRCRGHDADPSSCTFDGKRLGVSYSDEELLDKLSAIRWESLLKKTKAEATIDKARELVINAEQAMNDARALLINHQKVFEQYMDQGQVPPSHAQKRLEESEKAFADAEADAIHNKALLQQAESSGTKKTSAKAIRQQIQRIKESGLLDLEQRQEFNRWVHRQGVGLLTNFKNGEVSLINLLSEDHFDAEGRLVKHDYLIDDDSQLPFGSKDVHEAFKKEDWTGLAEYFEKMVAAHPDADEIVISPLENPFDKENTMGFELATIQAAAEAMKRKKTKGEH